MRRNIIFGTMILALMASCQNEDGALDKYNNASTMEVTAVLADVSDSRTTLETDGESAYKVVWSEGDQLSVFWDSPDAHNQFGLNSGEGETSATFKSSGEFVFGSNTEDGTDSFAKVGYYPYSASTTVSLNNGSYVVNAEIPVNQTYSENSFGQNVSPMVAIADDLKFAFKNVASYLKVNLTSKEGENVNITKATLESATTEIAGNCKITIPVNTKVPSVSFDDTEGSKMVVLNFNEALALDATTAKQLFFVFSPGTYSKDDLTLTFYDDNGGYYSTSLSIENTFERSQYKYADRTYGDTENGTNGTVGVEQANAALAKGLTDVTVTVSDSDSGSDSQPTVQLPANDSENPTNLTFASIPENASVTIEASTESNGEEADEVNVSVPSSNTGYNFNINLPNSTVTLLAGEGSATFSEVTASTADNTLIIDAGVTVTTLKLKKGNVRLREGACVGSISLESDNNYGDAKPRIIYEGSKPTGFDSDTFELITAAEWDLIQAIENAEDGGYVMLENNVELSTQLTITKSLTLDLNGKTLSNTSDIWNDAQGVKTWSLVSVQGENAHVTIAGNGSLLAKENDCYAIDARGGAVVDIMNGTYVGNISAVYAIRGGVVNIQGGTYSIQQLSTHNDYRYLLNLKDGDESSIQVTGGTFCNFDPANSHSENPIANFVAAGYSSIAYGANYVVTEGIKNESALIAAIASGLNEVTLSDNITLTSQLTITRSLALNLNGKTISNTSDIWNDTNKTWSLISVQGESDVEVTINLNGGSLAAKNEDCFAVDVRGGAKVSIQGEGTVKGNISAVYAIAGGVANIHGGTYSIQQLSAHNDYRYLLNLKDGDESSIEVTGGTFCNFNPADCLAEGANTNFVRVGYSSVAGDDNTYTVSEGIKNESALIAAIASLDQVVLSDDITLTSQLTITRSLYLDLNGKTISNTSDIWNDTNKTWSLISVQGDSEVDVLIDLNGGSLVAKENDCFAVDVRGGAKVSIQGEGTVKGNISAVYAIAGGAAIIQGGTYSIQQLSAYSDYRYLLNLKDNDGSSMQVTGGTFCNFNPANCLAEGEGTSFVVNGYESSTDDNGTTYYVVAKSESSEE